MHEDDEEERYGGDLLRDGEGVDHVKAEVGLPHVGWRGRWRDEGVETGRTGERGGKRDQEREKGEREQERWREVDKKRGMRETQKEGGGRVNI